MEISIIEAILLVSTARRWYSPETLEVRNFEIPVSSTDQSVLRTFGLATLIYAHTVPPAYFIEIITALST